MKENNENTMTYEEAKIILKNSVGDEIDKARSKAEKLRAGITTAIPLSIGVIGAMQGQPIAIPCTLAVALTLDIPILMATLTRLRINKRILDDSFFENKTKQEIIDAATSYKEKYEQIYGDQGGKSL